MAEWRTGDEPWPGEYAGPPPMPSSPAGYQPVMPPAYPYPPPYAYPPAGSPYAPPPGPVRPGELTGAAVVGFIEAGVLILASLILIWGATIVAGLDGGGYTVEVTLATIVNFVAAGLQIGGGASMLSGNGAGRVVFTVGCAIVALSSVYWLARWSSRAPGQAVIVYAVLFAGLAIVALGLTYTGTCRRWFAERAQPAAEVSRPRR